MAKLKKFFLFIAASILAVAFAYFSLVMSNLYLAYASLFCFATSTHAFMSLFKGLQPYRWAIPLLIAVTTCYTYRNLAIRSIDPELAELMGSSTDCASLDVKLVGGMGERIIKESQNVCYLSHIRENLKQFPPQQQIDGVFKAADALKKQKRLNATSLTLLAAIDVTIRAQEKIKAEDQDAISLGLMDDLTRLIELYPHDTEPAPQSPDALLVYNMDKELEHHAVIGIVSNIKASMTKFQQAEPKTRDPAAVDALTPLQQRVASIQARWMISDDELGQPLNGHR